VYGGGGRGEDRGVEDVCEGVQLLPQCQRLLVPYSAPSLQTPPHSNPFPRPAPSSVTTPLTSPQSSSPSPSSHKRSQLCSRAWCTFRASPSPAALPWCPWAPHSPPTAQRRGGCCSTTPSRAGSSWRQTGPTHRAIPCWPGAGLSPTAASSSTTVGGGVGAWASVRTHLVCMCACVCGGGEVDVGSSRGHPCAAWQPCCRASHSPAYSPPPSPQTHPHPHVHHCFHAGIVDETNPYDKLPLTVTLPSEDPLYRAKRARMAELNLSTQHTFQLARDGALPPDLLPYLRLSQVGGCRGRGDLRVAVARLCCTLSNSLSCCIHVDGPPPTVLCRLGRSPRLQLCSSARPQRL
jgi:hypothetical protein